MSKPPDPQPPRGTAPADEQSHSTVDRLEKALAEAQARGRAFENQLTDQQQRLEALGTGREETMRALAEARAELMRLSRERDDLRKQLARVDSVQTATLALPDADSAPPVAPDKLPSIEDLMAALGEMAEPSTAPDGHLQQRVKPEPDAESDSERSEEMLAPELVFPEQFAATADTGQAEQVRTSRVLVLLDPEHPIKYPLFKETMTIGRADSADIQINNGYLSRLHARVISTDDGVTVEDYDSKNGIRVNGKASARQALKHGDVVDLGRLRFRYIDTAEEDTP
jgi:hypothetical protein